MKTGTTAPALPTVEALRSRDYSVARGAGGHAGGDGGRGGAGHSAVRLTGLAAAAAHAGTTPATRKPGWRGRVKGIGGGEAVGQAGGVAGSSRSAWYSVIASRKVSPLVGT